MAKQAVLVQCCGDVIEHTAAADIAVGDVVQLTNLCGVAQVAIAKDATGTVALSGIYEIATDTGAAWSVGDLIYWDATNKKGTKTSTSNVAMGFAVAAKASAGTTCKVKLQAKL